MLLRRFYCIHTSVGKCWNLVTFSIIYYVIIRVKDLRAVFCKDRLRICKIEKSDFPKLCQKEGLDELFLKI